MDELKKQFAILYDDYENLYHNYRHTKIQNELLSRFISKKNDRNKKLLTANRNLCEELQSITYQIDQIKLKISSELEDLSDLITQNKELSTENKELQESIDILMTKHDKQISETKKSEEHLEFLKHDIIEKEQQKVYLEKECKRLVSGNNIIFEEVTQSNDQYGELYDEIEELTNTKNKLTAKIIKLDAHLETMRQIKMRKLDEIVSLTRGTKECLSLLQKTIAANS